jgi:hypothetical protein
VDLLQIGNLLIFDSVKTKNETEGGLSWFETLRWLAWSHAPVLDFPKTAKPPQTALSAS